MNTLKTLFLLAVGLSAAQCRSKRSLHQFRDMILCVDPDSTPILSYSNYGCYCGFGGSGTPVDDLDRCCQVHDQCYNDARHHPKCSPIFDLPHLEYYYFSCDEGNRKVTCESKNDECEMFICECDRKAAECFSGATVNPEFANLSEEHC